MSAGDSPWGSDAPDPASIVARGRVGRWGRTAIWVPGLAVAVGAAVATAHGLFEVAAAAGVPTGIAWLYPLITDGLALVAYAATARLRGSAAGYAWAVVIVSAGLSGLAQATYLTSTADTAADTPAPMGSGSGLVASAVLRFGVGAWPAIAAAIAAHLLYLLTATDHPPGAGCVASSSTVPGVPSSALSGVQRSATGVQPGSPGPASAPDAGPTEHSRAPRAGGPEQRGPEPTDRPSSSGRPTARERARDAARAHHRRHRAWPTVSELQTAAGVSRGTASTALREARAVTTTAPTPLHLITTRSDTQPSTEPVESDRP
ncbi:hypothetical protein H7X46_07635 [Pseudonocardia sp. C8]|uniref:hypothetical protein n=1 Tax=Pseudonocardia sp. C8 TaxID=2762759 RepID=UPI001642D712|nr:hypothetical protein [Pseudonocardia sp. C8]MBC3190932.1 hypothetical protein [Pseudonocardia sp. C8]